MKRLRFCADVGGNVSVDGSPDMPPDPLMGRLIAAFLAMLTLGWIIGLAQYAARVWGDGR